MSIFASLYTDEDMSVLVATLQKNAYEIAQRVGILVNALTVESIKNQLLYA